MPKVIHVLRKFVPSEWGGTETFVKCLIPELARLGWFSEIHAPREAGTDGSVLEEAGATFRTFRARYPYLGMNARSREWLVATGGNLVSTKEIRHLMTDRRASIFHTHAIGRLGGIVRWADGIARETRATEGQVPGHAPEVWAARLSEALADPAFLDRERRAGPARVSQSYSWRTVAERLADAYGRVLEGGRS